MRNLRTGRPNRTCVMNLTRRGASKENWGPGHSTWPASDHALGLPPYQERNSPCFSTLSASTSALGSLEVAFRRLRGHFRATPEGDQEDCSEDGANILVTSLPSLPDRCRPSPMTFEITDQQEDDPHRWTAGRYPCDLTDQEDALVSATAELVRQSYGEDVIIDVATRLLGEEVAAGNFRLDHLVNALRQGLPDPTSEGKKPEALTNYRSEAAEMVAKLALRDAYRIEFPVAAQEAKGNPNQPILGFDGWGIDDPNGSGEYVLALIQVKGTEDSDIPPRQATVLAEECKRIPKDIPAIIRALATMVILTSDGPVRIALLRMLEGLQVGKLPRMYAAPCVVKGEPNASLNDLTPIRDETAHFAPAVGRGLSVSLGVALAAFGQLVMNRARSVA